MWIYATGHHELSCAVDQHGAGWCLHRTSIAVAEHDNLVLRQETGNSIAFACTSGPTAVILPFSIRT